MIRMTILGITLLMSVPGEFLLYKVPEKATPEDLAKVAAAMTARCKAHGYKGMQASIVEREGRQSLQISSDSGFTPEMRLILNEFAWKSGSSIELRFPVVLTDVEKEQYQAHANPREDKAPPGAKWFRSRAFEVPPVLLRDTPVVTKSEILQKSSKDKTGGFTTLWEISRLQTRELREVERKLKLGTPFLILDGWVVGKVTLTEMEKNEEGQLITAERMSFVPSSALVREALLNPMPFALEIDDGTEGK